MWLDLAATVLQLATVGVLGATLTVLMITLGAISKIEEHLSGDKRKKRS